MKNYIYDVMNENEKFFKGGKKTDTGIYIFNAALSYTFTFIFTL